MSRKVLPLVKKVQNSMDMTQFQRYEQNATDSRKVKKTKEWESTSRSHSARNCIRESKTCETSRTRSVSPTPILIQPFVGSLPLEKFYNIYSKVLIQLETVLKLTETKENDSENFLDLRRQIQRADEFSIRFSRNNLYETKRIVNEIKKIMVPYPLDNLPLKDCKILCKKIVLAYQAASQALQTYINYIKNPSSLEIPDKINELILLIEDLYLSSDNIIPCDGALVQKDSLKLCKDLMALLKTKTPVCDYIEMKEADLVKKPMKPFVEDIQKMKRLSMYKSKLSSNVPVKSKETLKKKVGLSCLLGNRSRKLKKKDEKKARITHEIYTQKLNPVQAKTLGSKIVKFDSGKAMVDDKMDNNRDKRRTRVFTPREVRPPDDDDVETMVQAIKDDDVTNPRIEPTFRESDEESNTSSALNKSSFRELLLEAIEELQNSDKKEQKATLKKLLTSIQNCSKSENPSPRNPKVKVYHFKSKDLEEAELAEKLEKKKKEEIKKNSKVDLETLHAQQKEREAILARERALKPMFKPLKQKKVEENQLDVVPRGKIKMKISEDSMKNINKYRKAFAEYRKTDIMYKKSMSITPWELLGKVSDSILLDIIKEISQDLQNDTIIQRLYYNELVEVSR